MIKRLGLLIIIAIIAASSICHGAGAGSSKPRSKGVYVDSKGTRHPWEVNEAHTLIWDGSPYIPVGGMFVSKYLTFSQNEESWKEDTAALEILKEKGIKDLYINPVLRATDTTVEAWQRVIDYLEAHGFIYGIELTNGLLDPFEAYIVRPHAATQLRDGGTATLGSPGANQVLYLVSDAAGNPLDSGVRDLSKGNTALKVTSGAAMLRVVGRHGIDLTTTGYANYWDGYPDYRERILTKFAKIKPGPGLRFFVDPFINEMGMRGDASWSIPDSPRFRAELVLYLQKKYPRIEDLIGKWIPGESLAGGYREAARLIPLQQGAGYAMDPTNARLLKCTDKMWSDISRFRDESVLHYMNQASDLLKSKVANVPVIIKWTHPYPIYTNTDPKAGFDGLGMEAYAVGEALAAGSGVHTLCQVEDAARTQWLIVTETQDTPAANKPTMGYPSEEQMHSDLDWLRKAGAKGFYVFGLKLHTPWDNFELVKDPKQLDWLLNYRKKLANIPDFASNRTRTLPYPVGAGTSASIRHLSDGSWWIPTQRKGRSLRLPEGLDGYYFEDEVDTCVIWSPGEPRKISLSMPKGMKTQATLPGGKSTGELDNSGKHLSLTVGKDPVLLRDIPPSHAFPSDVAREQLEKFEGLIAKAAARKLSVEDYKQTLDEAKKIDCESNAREAYETIRDPMTTLQQKLTYIWIEGEASTDHNFSGTLESPGRSDSKHLHLWKSMDPLSPEGYRAHYRFEAKIEGDYEIWMAGTPPAAGWVSPAFFSIDSGEKRAVTTGPQSYYYADFGWTHLGTVKLTPGDHTLTIQAAERRKAPDNDYVLFIDAVVISPSPFQPSGIAKP